MEINENVIKELSEKIETIFYEIKKVIVGQENMIEKILIAILADGHVLLEGAPGLAKTMTLKTFAQTIKADFKRIQFTPDLLPADLIGTNIYSHSDNSFKTVLGPIFANLVLADEINRAPAKVQSALLEAMQEKQITIGTETYKLKEPFLVLATQNPIESEGTYNLPEAQVDRFMFKILVDYPNKNEEATIVERMLQNETPKVQALIDADEIIKYREVVNKIYADTKIIHYIVELVTATRNPSTYKELEDLEQYIEYGASPRASLAITQASKAMALIRGRTYVTPDDVKNVASDCLRHRLILSYEALAQDVKTDYIIDKIIENIEVPETTREA